MSDLKDDAPTITQLPAIKPDEYTLSVYKSLGLPPEKWNAAKVRSLNELGKYMALKTTARVLLVTTFDAMQQLEMALDMGKQMMSRPPGEISDMDRIASGKMMALCATGLKELTVQAIELAEKGIDDSEKPTAAAPPQPKNLPPSFRGVTVNVAPGSQVSLSESGKDNNGEKPALAG